VKDVIRLIGVICILAGLLYMARPDIPRRLMAFVGKGYRIYLAAILRFALAVAFLVGAEQCSQKWVIVAFGIAFLISGLLIFILGAKRLNAILAWYAKQPALILRTLGAIALAAGAIISYCA